MLSSGTEQRRYYTLADVPKELSLCRNSIIVRQSLDSQVAQRKGCFMVFNDPEELELFIESLPVTERYISEVLIPHPSLLSSDEQPTTTTTVMKTMEYGQRPSVRPFFDIEWSIRWPPSRPKPLPTLSVVASSTETTTETPLSSQEINDTIISNDTDDTDDPLNRSITNTEKWLTSDHDFVYDELIPLFIDYLDEQYSILVTTDDFLCFFMSEHPSHRRREKEYMLKYSIHVLLVSGHYCRSTEHLTALMLNFHRTLEQRGYRIAADRIDPSPYKTSLTQLRLPNCSKPLAPERPKYFPHHEQDNQQQHNSNRFHKGLIGQYLLENVFDEQYIEVDISSSIIYDNRRKRMLPSGDVNETNSGVDIIANSNIKNNNNNNNKNNDPSGESYTRFFLYKMMVDCFPSLMKAFPENCMKVIPHKSLIAFYREPKSPYFHAEIWCPICQRTHGDENFLYIYCEFRGISVMCRRADVDQRRQPSVTIDGNGNGNDGRQTLLIPWFVKLHSRSTNILPIDGTIVYNQQQQQQQEIASLPTNAKRRRQTIVNDDKQQQLNDNLYKNIKESTTPINTNTINTNVIQERQLLMIRCKTIGVNDRSIVVQIAQQQQQQKSTSHTTVPSLWNTNYRIIKTTIYGYQTTELTSPFFLWTIIAFPISTNSTFDKGYWFIRLHHVESLIILYKNLNKTNIVNNNNSTTTVGNDEQTGNLECTIMDTVDKKGGNPFACFQNIIRLTNYQPRSGCLTIQLENDWLQRWRDFEDLTATTTTTTSHHYQQTSTVSSANDGNMNSTTTTTTTMMNNNIENKNNNGSFLKDFSLNKRTAQQLKERTITVGCRRLLRLYDDRPPVIVSTGFLLMIHNLWLSTVEQFLRITNELPLSYRIPNYFTTIYYPSTLPPLLFTNYNININSNNGNIDNNSLLNNTTQQEQIIVHTHNHQLAYNHLIFQSEFNEQSLRFLMEVMLVDKYLASYINNHCCCYSKKTSSIIIASTKHRSLLKNNVTTTIKVEDPTFDQLLQGAIEHSRLYWLTTDSFYRQSIKEQLQWFPITAQYLSIQQRRRPLVVEQQQPQPKTTKTTTKSTAIVKNDTKIIVESYIVRRSHEYQIKEFNREHFFQLQFNTNLIVIDATIDHPQKQQKQQKQQQLPWSIDVVTGQLHFIRQCSLSEAIDLWNVILLNYRQKSKPITILLQPNTTTTINNNNNNGNNNGAGGGHHFQAIIRKYFFLTTTDENTLLWYTDKQEDDTLLYRYNNSINDNTNQLSNIVNVSSERYKQWYTWKDRCRDVEVLWGNSPMLMFL